MTFFFFLKKGEVSREETGNKRTAWSLNRFKKKMSPVNQNDWKLRLKKAKFPLFTLLLCTTHTYKRLNRLKTATDDVIGHIQSSNWSNTSLLQYVEKKKKDTFKDIFVAKNAFFFFDDNLQIWCVGLREFNDSQSAGKWSENQHYWPFCLIFRIF